MTDQTQAEYAKYAKLLVDRIESTLNTLQIIAGRVDFPLLSLDDTAWLEALTERLDEIENDWTPSGPAVAYYELTSRTYVNVVRIKGRIAYLDDGTTAHMRDLRIARQWGIDTERHLADAADARDTQADALDRSIQ